MDFSRDIEGEGLSLIASNAIRGPEGSRIPAHLSSVSEAGMIGHALVLHAMREDDEDTSRVTPVTLPNGAHMWSGSDLEEIKDAFDTASDATRSTAIGLQGPSYNMSWYRKKFDRLRHPVQTRRQAMVIKMLASQLGEDGARYERMKKKITSHMRRSNT